MTAEEFLRALDGDSFERLKWRAFCRFGIAPGSRAAKRLSDEDVIVCGAHMVLDSRLRSAGSGGETARSSSFDAERFARLSEEAYGC